MARKTSKDDFASIVNDIAQTVSGDETELAGTHPQPAAAGGIDLDNYNYKCSYKKLFIGNEADTKELEQIMNDSLSGRSYLAAERYTDTREGETYVIVKYFTPEPK